jgi:hypothetical protein
MTVAIIAVVIVGSVTMIIPISAIIMPVVWSVIIRRIVWPVARAIIIIRVIIGVIARAIIDSRHTDRHVEMDPCLGLLRHNSEQSDGDEREEKIPFHINSFCFI